MTETPLPTQPDDRARADAPTPGEPPASIGPYRILRELGSGGMGDVYLAEQLEPVRRRVALKVVKLGMDTREVVARFEAERQALAQMNHPHIAQVFDAGITQQGRPYFAMEYVGGTMLTSFCDQRALQPVQRARLMATVCRAVQHAHDRGFIHRDLKPSNVLVTEHEGEFLPKIIDFGIAKATAAAGDAAATRLASMHTRVGLLLGTPEYMSPEQLSSGGADIDTRSDVYALGVTLYELLCGELPIDSDRLRRGGPGDMERIVRDELPTGPSKRLSSVGDDVVAARGGLRTTVQRSVAGELDWITLKALAKNRDDRYRSALALAEDLERWLRHEPVLAAPPGRTYRLRKFVRRHRVAVTAAAVVLVSLVTGLAVSLHSLSREARALDEARSFYGLARDAVGNLVDAADSQLADVPQADAVRRRMLADAIAFYGQLRAKSPQDPALRYDMLAATARIGELQRRLGQTTDALATLQRCVAEVDTLCDERPDDARLRSLAMATHAELVMTLTALGRRAAAKTALQQALARAAEARSLPRHDPRYLDLAEAKLLTDVAIECADDVPAALALHERALTLWARIGDNTFDRDHVRCIGRYAETLTRAGRLDDAARVLTDAITRLQDAPAGRGTALRESEARVQSQVATVLRRLERRDDARAAQQRAIALYEELAREHPDVPTFGDEAAAGVHFLANLARDEAKPQEALSTIARAVELRERLAAAHPQNHGLTTRWVRILLTQASFQIDLWQSHGGDVAPATATIDRAQQLATELRAAHGDDLDVSIAFAAVTSARGALFAAEKRFEDAQRAHLAVRELLLAELDTFAASADLRYQLALNTRNLMQVAMELKDAARARADGEHGLAYAEQGLALDARHAQLLELVPTLVLQLAGAYVAEGNREAAFQCLLRLCEQPAWGAEAKERGCMELAGHLLGGFDADEQRRWSGRVQQELRAVLAARGDVAAALLRPPQKGGFGNTTSRMRDVDLLLSLADLCLFDGQFDEIARLHADVTVLLDSMPDVRDRRVRRFARQRAEAALQQDRPDDAEAAMDAMHARMGPDPGSDVMGATYYRRCFESTTDAAAKEARAVKAVACLRRALAAGALRPEDVGHESFASLRGRADYAALLDK